MRSTLRCIACARSCRPSTRRCKSSTLADMDMRFARNWRRSLGARLLATYVAGLLVSVVLLSAAVLVKLNLATDSMAAHALEGQVRWLKRGLQFDAAGQPGLTGEAA